MSYEIKGIQKIPVDFSGVPVKIDGSNITVNSGQILAYLFGTMRTTSDIDAMVAYDLGNRLFNTKEDSLPISSAEKSLVERVLEEAQMTVWVRAFVNKNMVREIQDAKS